VTATAYVNTPAVRTESAIGDANLWNGREYDAESGLYYYRLRYLDPELGRFTTLDPIGLWGDPNNLGNGYAYVGNRPWTGMDPFGLDDILDGIYDLDRGLSGAPGAFGAQRAAEERGNTLPVVVAIANRSAIENAHLALDVGGFATGVGVVFDVANGMLYTFEWKLGEAAWSFTSAVPVGGGRDWRIPCRPQSQETRG
jgi:RHS repeat-associated protein